MKNKITLPLFILLLMSLSAIFASGCSPKQNAHAKDFIDSKDSNQDQMKLETNNTKTEKNMADINANLDTATFGAGCFWCIEAVFQRLEGVDTVISGYTGGQTLNPTYKDICTGMSGHAEVAQITYNPEIITFDELLEVFWATHDPTTLNRQGNDVGTQYRSAVFYHTDEQKEKAEFYLQRLTEEKVFDKPIVTEISPLGKFYVAESYHQNYYNNNKTQGYCSFVISPKVDKLKKVFPNKLKKEYAK
jgi:peptide-methionine (S)-S-oxide reductase